MALVLVVFSVSVFSILMFLGRQEQSLFIVKILLFDIK